MYREQKMENKYTLGVFGDRRLGGVGVSLTRAIAEEQVV